MTTCKFLVDASYPAVTPRGFTLARMNSMMESIGVPGWKTAATPAALQSFDILIGDNSANHHQHVVHLVLLQQLHDTGDDGIVGSGKNAEADHVHVFLQ